MNLNPFLAALGGAFRGAAMDTEMQRRLQEAEAERQRIARAEARQAELDARQVQMEDFTRAHQNLATAVSLRKEGYRPIDAILSDLKQASSVAPQVGVGIGGVVLPQNLARVAELAKANATADRFTLPDKSVVQYDPSADPDVIRSRTQLTAKQAEAAQRAADLAFDKTKFDETVRHNKAMESKSDELDRDRVRKTASDRVASWALSTMQAGETDPGRLQTAAAAMFPNVDAADRQGAVANARMMFDRGENVEARTNAANRKAGSGRGFSAAPPGTPATPPTPATTPRGSAADRWEALRQQYPNKSDDEITAMVKREFNLP